MFGIKGESNFLCIKTWVVLAQIVIVYFLTVITFAFIESLIGIELEFLKVAMYHLIFIYIVIRTFRIHDIPLLQVTGGISLTKQPWLILLGFLFVLKLFAFFSQSIGTPIISFFYPEIYDEVFAAYSDAEVVVDINMILMVVISFTLGPIIEELFFRGYLLNKWGAKFGVGKAVIISSLLFAILHFNFILLFPYFIAGIFYSLVYLKTKKLIVPIILHSVSNFASAVLVFTPNLNFTSPEQLKMAVSIGVILYILLLPIVCLILYRYYCGIPKVTPYAANKSLVG